MRSKDQMSKPDSRETLLAFKTILKKKGGTYLSIRYIHFIDFVVRVRRARTEVVKSSLNSVFVHD